jgi:phosphate starvation-inducible PhoH-like protein
VDAYDAARLSDLPPIAVPEPIAEVPRVALPKTRSPRAKAAGTK